MTIVARRRPKRNYKTNVNQVSSIITLQLEKETKTNQTKQNKTKQTKQKTEVTVLTRVVVTFIDI